MQASKINKQNKSAVHRLVCAALEAWCHHLLYVRRIYPKETFCNTYFLGIRCKANRHPDIVSYISRAVEVAVPALIGPDRVADEICLEVVDYHHREKEKEGPKNEDANSNTNRADKLFPSSDSQEQYHRWERQHSQQSPFSDQESTSTISDKKRKIQSLTDLPFQQEEEDLTQNSTSSLSTAVQLQQHDEAGKRSKTEAYAVAAGKASDDDHHKQEHQEVIQQRLWVPTAVAVLERFSLTFSSALEEKQTLPHGDKRSTTESHNVSRRSRRNLFNQTQKQDEARGQNLVPGLERSFRNLILNLSSLKRDRVSHSNGLAFKLVLHVDNGAKTCLDIQKAFKTGSWFPCAAETTTAVAERRPTMFRYCEVVGDCEIRFNVQRQSTSSM